MYHIMVWGIFFLRETKNFEQEVKKWKVKSAMSKLKWKIDLKLLGPIRHIDMEVHEVEWGCRNEEDEMNERFFRYKNQ